MPRMKASFTCPRAWGAAGAGATVPAGLVAAVGPPPPAGGAAAGAVVQAPAAALRPVARARNLRRLHCSVTRLLPPELRRSRIAHPWRVAPEPVRPVRPRPRRAE